MDPRHSKTMDTFCESESIFPGDYIADPAMCIN